MCTLKHVIQQLNYHTVMRIEVGERNQVSSYVIFLFYFVAHRPKISKKILIVTFIVFLTQNELCYSYYSFYLPVLT